MKGLLLKEDKKILVQQTANVQAARQSKTRKARIEKYILKILEGKGLEDYKTIIKNGTENST